MAMCSHVVTQFCPDVNLFCNLGHLEEWRAASGAAPEQAVTVAEVAYVGRRWWSYLHAAGEGARP